MQDAKSKSKLKKPTTNKPARNPAEPLALALSVVEAAVAYPLTPKNPLKKKPAASKSKKLAPNVET